MVDCFLLSCSSACMTRLTTFRDDIKSSPKRKQAKLFLRGTLHLFLFCFFSKWKVCFFAHQNQSHFLLRHSFLQFFKGIVLVFHRSFVVRTFESCHLAFVTQMMPTFFRLFRLNNIPKFETIFYAYSWKFKVHVAASEIVRITKRKCL